MPGRGPTKGIAGGTLAQREKTGISNMLQCTGRSTQQVQILPLFVLDKLSAVLALDLKICSHGSGSH